MQSLEKNNNTDLSKSTEDMKCLMQQVLATAQKKGATEASVTMNKDCGFAVDVRMGEVETVSFSEDKNIQVTVYVGARKGSASSTDTSVKAIEAMVNAAYDIAKVSAEDTCFGLPEAHLIHNHYPDLKLLHPWPISPEQAIEKALACEQYALKQDKRIINSDGANVSTYTFSHGYANTNGCEAVVNSSNHSMSCSLIAKEHDSMQRDFDYTVSRDANELLNVELLAKSVVERTTSRLNAKKLKTQKTPVVFSSRVSNSLMSHFIQAISGSNLYRENSFLLDAIGKSIFSDDITIYEQPHLLKALGSSPLDAEGVPTRQNIFIENGLLRQYALSCYSARRLGLETTANSGGVFNLTVKPTANDLNDVIKKMDRGFLITELMGQGVNILTGDYSRGASGFWVENGEIQYPVEEVTVAGHLKRMFQGITAVGSDINPNIATRCGSLLIDEMMVGGS